MGIGSKHTLKFFPLTKRICLHIDWREREDKDFSKGIPFVPISSEFVDFINGVVAVCAKEYIYGEDEEVLKKASRMLKNIFLSVKRSLKN